MTHFSRQTFDSFFEGEKNKAARLAALEVARNPGERFNPLYIFGGTGSGKSHLLNAIAEEILGGDPSIHIYNDNYSAFATEVEEYVETEERYLFLSQLSFHDVFLLDDLETNETWIPFQDEMIEWIDRFVKEKKQIVFTSNRPLLQMTPLDRRFLARIQRGLIISLGGADRVVRERIIVQAFGEEEVQASEEAVAYLAGLPVVDVRELAGIINRLFLSLSLEGAQLTGPWCVGTLRAMVENGEIRRFEIPDAGPTTAPEEYKEEALSELLESGVVEPPEVDDEFEIPGELDEEIDEQESEPEEVHVPEVANVGNTTMEIDEIVEDEIARIDETERLIMEWDREEDRLLNDL